MKSKDKRSRRRQRESDAFSHSSDGSLASGQSRQSCKAPRLDNADLMDNNLIDAEVCDRSEFLNLWLEQLEETSRTLPHEKLLQRVVELETELVDTQEKLKRATTRLETQKSSSSHGRARARPYYVPFDIQM
ncbi:Oidioi.mRNA.OKI2018_I69.XSR.g15903.t1.cds [Oikopleura dioica]|uniref:Oidioi.mRNA.OKI2018_I69.XSR.g15903.t1.cds n=1 Tax=Oikopleura dioica TaxID=34765 RepID=A0ABN7SIC3_OIKDI|nr:Oidioi.mRNA.OKI2018_I69.XSR.g15903.t1.cds [Oikopleura dioica]